MEKLNVKKGDKVIVFDGYGGSRISEVEKVKDTGSFKVNGIVYSMDGNEKFKTFGAPNKVKLATEKEIERMEQLKVIRYVLMKMGCCTSLTYEQAVAIDQILKSE